MSSQALILLTVSSQGISQVIKKVVVFGDLGYVKQGIDLTDDYQSTNELIDQLRIWLYKR